MKTDKELLELCKELFVVIFNDMKGHFDKVYVATKDKDFGNTANCDFDIITSERPTDLMYKVYYSEKFVEEMLEKLKVVCGKSAMRYVEKQLNMILGEQHAKSFIGL